MKNEIQKIFYTTVTISKIKFNIYSSSTAVCKISMNEKIDSSINTKKTKLQEDDPYFFGVVKQLKEYFNGERKSFNIPLELKGTEFQKRVWNELIKIPYGDAASYKEIAEKIGSKKSYRAVGNANGKNPIPIIIPCHRVIISNGKLGGYTGGLEIKIKLLELEGYLSGELFE